MSQSNKQIQQMADWIKTNAVHITEGSVNKTMIRHSLFVEFDVQDEEVIDEVYNLITE
ncbi:hypothetical protein JCM9140_2919 [Halalkalibacter wakoensis JCM 9140]|uniref:Uncharacterized protein n=1 Tax=Halalkalibacter wakoensis JCM 9140 TaxID=1236970 RepID=W4Q4A4_9BACI|nr:hypothetical protein [Halalkalibacter wakoensis]GAE26817.1 hypothetical protein JCM9140_2919 [Halalkalibacter wakoensis JCM 9140]